MRLPSKYESNNTFTNKDLHITYEELIQISDDICYKTTTDPHTNENHHQITRPVVASINNFKQNGHMKNIIYTDGSPTTIELTDPSLTYRYNDYFQISYIVTGKIFLQINDTEITVEEGGILLIDDNTYYREDLSRSEGTVINISVIPKIINEIFIEYDDKNTLQGFLHRSFIKEKEKQNMLYFKPKNPEENSIINTLLSNALIELKTKDKGYLHICKGYILRILDYIAREYQYPYTKEEQDSFRMYLFNEVKVYLFHNYRDIQIQDLVDHFHYHRNYFNQLIKDFTGLTYSKYLIEIRILQAQHLLTSTDFNVDEIMLKVGYNNKGFFYSNFHELIGMNPAQYRKTIKDAKTSD